MDFIGAILGAMREAKREKARVKWFNARWNKLNNIRGLVTDDFIEPLNKYAHMFTESELDLLNKYVEDMNGWRYAINKNINNAGQRHLTQYATAIKKTAIKAIKLCQKYGVYSDIKSIEYDASRKMLVMNGQDLYCFD